MDLDLSKYGLRTCRIDQLKIGDMVDLEGDEYADTADENSPDFGRFAFEYETVAAIERENQGCIRVDFESGFSCGFPPTHVVELG